MRLPKIDISKLSDVRILEQIVFVIIVIMVSWSGVKTINRNYELQKDISVLKQEVEIAELENQNLKLQNQFLETDEYLNIAVRESFGKAGKDEKIYVVPDEVALKYIPKIPIIEPEQSTSIEKPWYQQNLDAWGEFFFKD